MVAIAARCRSALLKPRCPIANRGLAAGVKQFLSDVDRNRFDSRLRKLHSRYFVTGQHWGEFLEEAERYDRPGVWVLDAGAGQAQFRANFERANYVALDTAVGQSDWDYSHLDVLGDVNRLPLASDRFDLIFCTEVLEHLPAPAGAAAEFARVLKPGGRLLLATPQAWPQHQKPHDFYRYTSFGLRYLFESAGLQLCWLWPAGGAFTHAMLSVAHACGDDAWSGSSTARRATRPARMALSKALGYAKPAVAVLDRLDRGSDNTVGWFLCAEKPAVSHNGRHG